MSKKVFPLLSPADGEKAQPILDELKKKGFRLAGQGDQSAPVLLFLSAAFAADESAQEAFFAADGAGREIIPVDLDGTAQPELVRSALLAKNAIATQGRTAEEIAARVASASAFAKKETPKWLAPVLIVSALLLVVGAGLWLWLGRAPKEAPPPAETAVPAAPLRFGLSEEDLKMIGWAMLAGDRLYYVRTDNFTGWPQLYDYVSDNWDDEGRHFYRNEDGREIEMTHYDDLSLFALMPKLSFLMLIDVDCPAFPSLGNLSLLDSVEVYNCRLGGCEWLEGSRLQHFTMTTSDIADFTPLSSCKSLISVTLELRDATGCDFSSFAPRRLHELMIHDCRDDSLDLSALSDCTMLMSLSLERLPIENLDFLPQSEYLTHMELYRLEKLRDISALEGIRNLRELVISDCDALEDVSALAGTANLRELAIADCDRLRDLSPLADAHAISSLEIRSEAIRDFSALRGCSRLKFVNIDARGLRDASFLSEMNYLSELRLGFDSLPNVDFLTTLNENVRLKLELHGYVADYSGLAGPGQYYSLEIDTSRADLERVLVYLQETKIRQLSLWHFKEADWALVPRPSDELYIRFSELRDLSGMPAWDARNLTLTFDGLTRLRSLDGLEALGSLDSGTTTLQLWNCTALGDVSALEGAYLRSLLINGAVAVPELGGFGVSRLTLQNIAELPDLRCLDGLDASRPCDFELVGLESLRDLSALRRFGGESLTVPPQLAEQAEELVGAGNFDRFEIVYPEGGWSAEDIELTIESLDELETLSPALLRHVKRLVVAGEELIDPNANVWTYTNWDGGRAVPMLHYGDSDEDVEIAPGVIGDLSALYALTGLEELALWNQPLGSLEGIQSFPSLRRLELRYCENLTDVSAAFTLDLEMLSLDGSPVRSIRGVQNLEHLWALDLSDTAVDDLSPLAGMDFGWAARERGGLELHISGLRFGDYSALGSIAKLRYLDIEGADSALWTMELRDTEIESLVFFNSEFDSESFAAFARQHPELRQLHMPWNEGIGDLTVLLELPELEYVDVSFNMEGAVASLRGKDLGFELTVEQPD